MGLLFDLIRNGKAHQYESPVVELNDGAIEIDISGPRAGREIKADRLASGKHLQFKVDRSTPIRLHIYVEPDQLFLDFKNAISHSGIIGNGAAFQSMARPKGCNSPHYSFLAGDFETKLREHGHQGGEWSPFRGIWELGETADKRQ